MSANTKQYDAIFTTGIATIGILLHGSRLTKVDYLRHTKTIKPTTKPAAIIQHKIEQYLKPHCKIKKLDIEVQLEASAFQSKVLEQLRQIPYGETRTYGEIAEKLNTSPRAVGNACRNNPVPIIIPCHRVVAANSIGGYSGATRGVTLDMKVQLLRLEGAL